MKVLSVISNNKDAVTKEYVDSKAGVTAVDPTSGSVETDFFIPTKTSDLTNDSGFITEAALTTKQDTLVSGTNIKTINNQSLLGSGNIDVSGGGGTPTDVRVNGTSITSNNIADIITEGTYNASSNKIATMSDIGTKVDVTKTVGNLTSYIQNNGSTIALSVNNTALNKSNALLLTSAGITFGDESANPIEVHGVAIPTTDNSVANKKYVDDAITALPEPMIFKGSVGTDGTVT